MEGHAGDVSRVALKGEHGIGVRRLDVVELDGVVAGGGEVALVGRDAKAVDLRFWVLDRAGADAREGLPESKDGAATLAFPSIGWSGSLGARRFTGGPEWASSVRVVEEERAPYGMVISRCVATG